MKKIASAIIVASMLSIGSVSADTHGEMNENHMEEKNEINSEYKEKKDSMDMDHKEKMEEKHKEDKESRKKMKEENKKEIKPFFDALPQDTQDKLKELKAERKKLTEKERGETKIEHFEKVKEIVGDKTEEARAFISKCEEIHSRMKEERMENKEENKEMRGEMKKENKEMRDEYKEKRFELRMKYKKAIAKKLGDRINKMSIEKLENVVVKIDKKITEIEANEKLTDAKKEKIIAILLGLKDVINEKLDGTSDELIVEDLLK